ncbi:N-acetylmuramoyl-L-alanine amidase [Flavobacterium sp. TAB 87]|uniref:N-acetylmuramoyl-L-alanine amidase n=1 Tax=Flavobacterium sp. TAB 87 TaxID=1729581 RepID=UPI00076C910C|nr:N-acetylmuramoyl-L-alanine amidase [Flavobacterium sp. TAB 87]KVV15327.1 N-acetylmuramoyl-L-alanine amidase AmiD precursor [Flavobacterium sp. TAB 87]
MTHSLKLNITPTQSITKYLGILFLGLVVASCGSTKPYQASEKSYKEQLEAYKMQISSMKAAELSSQNNLNMYGSADSADPLTLYRDSLAIKKPVPLPYGIKTEWISTVNFNLRKPNYIILHHTAQDSLAQTIKTFTNKNLQVSSHYVIGDDGTVVQMLNDYLRAWHAGSGTWGRDTDINSASIGIELDNNGFEPFSLAQINSLLALLTKLKKDYNIPTQNIIGHSDIAPSRKQDPSNLFPWKALAANGFGLWQDEFLTEAPFDFQIEPALRIIGYNTKNLSAAIIAFKRHYIPEAVDNVLDRKTINTIYSIYKKQ